MSYFKSQECYQIRIWKGTFASKMGWKYFTRLTHVLTLDAPLLKTELNPFTILTSGSTKQMFHFYRGFHISKLLRNLYFNLI